MPAIPLSGDRSAREAGSYPTLHADDIDTSASGIHHTLGIGAYQAASGSHIHLLDSLSSGSATNGFVLTADGSGSATWQPVDSWRVTLTEDTSVNDSDKTFTVPVNKEWQILWVWVEYISTATVGERQLELQLQSSASIVIGQIQTGVVQSQSLTYKYLFAIAVPDLKTMRDTTYLTTPLPGGTFLSAGQKVRIWDNNAVDAAADDMTIRMQYAQRGV